MSVATADLHKALNTVWNASSLDATFKALWDASITDAEFPALHDQEAAPGQPFPYCVLDQSASSTVNRMSATGAFLREVRDVSWSLHVHARAVSGDSRTAKEIAAYLAEEIMKVFGGHPTVAPTALTLDNGNFLIAQYQNDFVIRTGDDEYRWTVEYVFRSDVPVAV